MKNISNETIDALTYALVQSNVSVEDALQIIKMQNERKEILKKHKTPISQNAKDLRWRTRVNGKLVVRKNRKDLEDYIVEYYKNKQDMVTLKNLYDSVCRLKETENSINTLKKYQYYWKTYFLLDEISNIPIVEMTQSDYRHWATKIICQYHMKKKYFSNVNALFNSLINEAIEQGKLESNIFKDVKLNKKIFSPTIHKSDSEVVFSEEEELLLKEQAMKDACEKHDAIPLGIILIFYTGMRVGELCALKYKDFQGTYIRVERMQIENNRKENGEYVRDGYIIVEHAKTEAGLRNILIPKQAQLIIDKIKDFNVENNFDTNPEAFVFMRKNNTPVNHRCFDSRIRKYCKKLGLSTIKSPHDGRRTYASHLYENNVNPKLIQKQMGHENIEMTLQYCKNRNTQSENMEAIQNAFSTHSIPE